MQRPRALSGLSPQNFFPKIIRFIPKKLSLKKVFIYSQKKFFSISWEVELSYIFSGTFFFIFKRIELFSNKNKKFQDRTFQVWKRKKTILKKCLIFWGMELSIPKLKKLFLVFFKYFRYYDFFILEIECNLQKYNKI